MFFSTENFFEEIFFYWKFHHLSLLHLALWLKETMLHVSEYAQDLILRGTFCCSCDPLHLHLNFLRSYTSALCPVVLLHLRRGRPEVALLELSWGPGSSLHGWGLAHGNFLEAQRSETVWGLWFALTFAFRWSIIADRCSFSHTVA